MTHPSAKGALRPCTAGTDRTGHCTTAVVWIALALLLPHDLSAQAVDGASVINAVRVVPLGPRASVVLVLDDEIDQLAIAESSVAGVFAVTFGPIEGPLAPLTLEATNPSRLVRAVRIREHARPDGAMMVRVEVVALEPLQGSVRTSRRHLYLDVAAITR